MSGSFFENQQSQIQEILDNVDFEVLLAMYLNRDTFGRLVSERVYSQLRDVSRRNLTKPFLLECLVYEKGISAAFRLSIWDDYLDQDTLSVGDLCSIVTSCSREIPLEDVSDQAFRLLCARGGNEDQLLAIALNISRRRREAFNVLLESDGLKKKHLIQCLGVRELASDAFGKLASNGWISVGEAEQIQKDYPYVPRRAIKRFIASHSGSR